MVTGHGSRLHLAIRGSPTNLTAHSPKLKSNPLREPRDNKRSFHIQKPQQERRSQCCQRFIRFQSVRRHLCQFLTLGQMASPVITSPPCLPLQEVIEALPFYDDTGKIEEFPELKELGYELIDVKGDGHCGYYCLIMGRIMYHQIPPTPKRGRLKDLRAVREAMYQTLKHEGPSIIEANKDQDFSIQFMITEEWDDNLTSMWNPRSPKSYDSLGKRSPKQMLSGWGPMTAAATFRFPIVLYTRHTSKTSAWLTAFYDGHQYSSDTHILPTQFYPGLHVPRFDPQFPPLAIVLQSSNDPNAPQHYLFLRAARPPATSGIPAPENSTLPPVPVTEPEKTTENSEGKPRGDGSSPKSPLPTQPGKDNDKDQGNPDLQPKAPPNKPDEEQKPDDEDTKDDKQDGTQKGNERTPPGSSPHHTDERKNSGTSDSKPDAPPDIPDPDKDTKDDKPNKDNNDDDKDDDDKPDDDKDDDEQSSSDESSIRGSKKEKPPLRDKESTGSSSSDESHKDIKPSNTKPDQPKVYPPEAYSSLTELPTFQTEDAAWHSLKRKAEHLQERTFFSKTEITEILVEFYQQARREGRNPRGIKHQAGASPFSRIKCIPKSMGQSQDMFYAQIAKKRRLVALSVPQALEFYDHQYLELLKLIPNRWFTTTLGAPGDSNSPRHLRSKIHTRYTQGENHHCLAYSLASALHYCGFTDAGRIVWDHAVLWSHLPIDDALLQVRKLVAVTAPSIGGATQFMKRTARHRIRQLTIDQVVEQPTPYPWLIVPCTADGVINHALCVVDDLVFDSITPRALRLCHETFAWIFNDQPITVHRAMRFDQNITPKKARETYTRAIALHFP